MPKRPSHQRDSRAVSCSFGRRLTMVLLTYATRPLCWVVSLVVLGGWLFLLFSVGDGHGVCSPEINVKKSRIYRIADLRERIESGQGNSITDIHYSRLWSDAKTTVLSTNFAETTETAESKRRPVKSDTVKSDTINERAAQQLAVLETLPNLIRLDLRIKFSGELGNRVAIRQIGRIGSLREVRLMAAGLDKQSLEPLAKLHHLQRLELNLAIPLPSLAPLAGLPELQTLMLPHCDGFTVERFDEIAQLTHLKTLVLPNLNAFKITPEMLNRLRGMSELTDVYVRVPPEDVASLDVVRKALPNVTVHRGLYRAGRVYSLLGGILVMLAVATMVLNATGQFSLSQSKVIPNYVVAHLIGVSVPAAISISVHSGILCYHGANWSPASAWLLFTFSLFAWSYVSTAIDPLSFSSKMSGIVIGLIGGLGPYILFAMAASWAGFAEAFLLGEIPAATIGLFVAGCLIVADSLRRLPRCHDVRAEAGLLPVLAFRDQQAANLTMLYDPPESAKLATFLKTAKDRAVDRGVEGGFHENRFWRRMKLWQAAMPTQRMRIIVMAPVIVVWMAVFPRMFGVDLRADSLWLGGPALLYLMANGIAVIGWWQGTTCLSSALMWPLDRRTLIRDVFSAVALDLLIPSPLILCMTIGWMYTTYDGVNGASLLAALVGSLGIVSLMHSIGVWMISFRRIRMLIVAFILAEAAFGAACMALMVPINGPGFSGPTPMRIAVVGIAACLVAALSTTLAWRRWLRLEFGQT